MPTLQVAETKLSMKGVVRAVRPQYSAMHHPRVKTADKRRYRVNKRSSYGMVLWPCETSFPTCIPGARDNSAEWRAALYARAADRTKHQAGSKALAMILKSSSPFGGESMSGGVAATGGRWFLDPQELQGVRMSLRICIELDEESMPSVKWLSQPETPLLTLTF
ncbi:hypothetical protein PENSPDRAFT_740621 [Peniophora sp. CONT]|nr:hypothetical protein PENSPDRAFT_740621 [Peniophora sp. CONT]